MAIKTPITSRLGDRLLRVTWAGLRNGDVGVGVAGVFDCSVQVSGDFGLGGEVSIQGSNDSGVTFSALHNPQGFGLNISESGVAAVSEFVELIRPVIAGDDTTSLTVTLIAKG